MPSFQRFVTFTFKIQLKKNIFSRPPCDIPESAPDILPLSHDPDSHRQFSLPKICGPNPSPAGLEETQKWKLISGSQILMISMIECNLNEESWWSTVWAVSLTWSRRNIWDYILGRWDYSWKCFGFSLSLSPSKEYQKPETCRNGSAGSCCDSLLHSGLQSDHWSYCCFYNFGFQGVKSC